MPTINLKLNPEEHIRLKIYAAHRNTTMSQVIRDAIPKEDKELKKQGISESATMTDDQNERDERAFE